MTMEYPYETSESWNTALQLASAVGRLKIASNLKAVNDAQQAAFHEAGRACALIGDANMREGGSQAPAFRDARGALAQCRAWLHIIAELTNEPRSTFENELELVEQATKQVNASLRVLEMRRENEQRGRGGPGGGRGPQGGGGYSGRQDRGPQGGGGGYGGRQDRGPQGGGGGYGGRQDRGPQGGGGRGPRPPRESYQ